MAGVSTAASSALKLATNMGSRKLLLGKCYPCYVPKATKVFVKMMDWDDYLKMYFRRFDSFYAYDPEKTTKTGDIVLIEEFQRQLTRDITHKVLKVVYPMGDVTDPISGKKCVGTTYREEEEWKDQLWGRNKNSFDYNKAPPRGWQEGRKDFSHKPAQRRFHEFTDRDITHMEW